MNPDNKAITILGTTFFVFFLALTPLGLFDDSIPKNWHTGHYSVTQIDGADDSGYYAYLRSAFFDGDLDFINEKRYAHIENFTSTGYVFNNWTIGQSILFLPFFLLGHLIAIVLNNFGYSFSIDGYSTPYLMATAIASQTYLFLGLLILFRILTKYFHQNFVVVTIIGVWLASPLIYYSFIRQRMAHTVEFFMAVVFVYSWLKLRTSEDNEKHAFLGVILGLFCMVRILNISFFALYFVDQLVLKKIFSSKIDKQFLKGFFLRSFWMLLFFFIALSPQLLMWKLLNGTPLPTRNLQLANAGLEFLFTPTLLKNIFDVLFSPQWGLLISFPIFIFSTLGFFVNKQLNEIKFGILTYIASMILIIAIFPGNSDAFGERHFISSMPLLAIGLGGIVNRFKNVPTALKGGIILVFSFAVLQYFLLIQYKTNIPYNDPHFSLKALSGIQSLFLENNQLLSRSTNFLRILLSAKSELFNQESFLFLFLYPSAQLVCIVLICFLFLRFNKTTIEKNRFSKGAMILILLSNLICFLYIYKIMPAKTPEQIKARHLYAKAIKAGNIKAINGNIKEALSLFSDAGKNLPDHWGSYFKIGSVYNTQLSYETANNYYQKVLELNPYHAETYRNIGRNHFHLGQFKEAEFFLKKSIELDPFNEKSFHFLALVLLADQNRIVETLKMFEYSLALNPNYKNAHLNFAVFLGLLKQTQKAILHFKEASRLGVKMEKIRKLTNQLGLSFEN